MKIYCVFTLLSGQIWSMMFSYLDKMTRVYLSLISFYLRAELLLKDFAVYPSNACDVMWFLTRHHFENLDSVNSRGSSLDKHPIRTISSQSRPRSISSFESSKKSLFIKWDSANLLPKSYYHYWQKAIKNRAQLWHTEYYSRQLADNNKWLLAFHGRRKIISHGSRKGLERNKSALMAYRSHILPYI